ncbi:OstA-like protein [Elizabethkingia sp. JS20170427COW]|uniref:OstA-like protein n=1 Tax=Elizabethkingia sp. JS20170427COW TaxID=2583851 RepID=UPI00111041E0|nr:OstA-like protein [Elizabethkingia sp. JS20170427COW]QCX53584.1 organic solvent tolerance protein OstA [Elizabethkingia sp. JS20170427COW]
MNKFFLLFLFCCFWGWGQQKKAVSPALKKDVFFNKKNAKKPTAPPSKIELKNADSTNVKAELYDGNPYFEGHVELHHEGSILKSDLVILYQKENFVKAIGHVDITNPDGTHLVSDEAEYDGNTQKAIARGNVVLTDPNQRIETETLYYDRITGTAYFNENGTIYVPKDNSVIHTKLGTYYVREQRIIFDENYRIDNDQYITEGKNVNYLRGEGVAIFHGPTTVTNKQKPSNYVYTEEGKYNMNTKEVFLHKNSYIKYNGKILTGDDMFFNQLTGFGKATGNVKLDDPAENRLLLGGYGEIYEKKDSAMVTQKPYAIKIFKNDSAYIAAQTIIAYQKPDSTGKVKKSYLKAYKQARMFKTNGQGRADSLSYNETDGIMHFVGKPIFWTGEKQVTGDIIKAYSNPELEQVDSIHVEGNAFAISKADSLNLKDEFNQVKGNLMTVYLKDNELDQAHVVGNAVSIVYADNQDSKTKTTERIGINYSTCGIIKVKFTNRKVETISCEIGALSDTYPMSKISKEKRFFPDFNWNTKDRPKRWQDIFLNTPNYPETQYTSENPLYDAAQAIIQKQEEEKKAKEPKRIKKE